MSFRLAMPGDSIETVGADVCAVLLACVVAGRVLATSRDMNGPAASVERVGRTATVRLTGPVAIAKAAAVTEPMPLRAPIGLARAITVAMEHASARVTPVVGELTRQAVTAGPRPSSPPAVAGSRP